MAVQSAERVSQRDASDNFVFQRSILAYYAAAEMISGKVLEIGTGSGYGVEVVAPKSQTFTTVDKFDMGEDFSSYSNVEFRQMNVPPLAGLENSSFDYVITFQVIEHIRDDRKFLQEIHRVLKPGGKLIVSTPNRKMSLTRNPWHVREYSSVEFTRLLEQIFTKVEANGVFGNEKVMEYYLKNKESVERISRFDIFGFRNWLPKALLKVPYDIMNRINRKKLLKENTDLTSGIKMEDYFITPVGWDCFDLFYIAEK